MNDSPAAIIFNVDGYAADVIEDVDGNRGLHSTSPFTVDREKLVGVSFFKEGVPTTTYYMGIDLSNTTDFKHTPGDGIQLAMSIGKAFKTIAGARWRVQLLVVLRIDGTDADVAVLSQASLTLQETGQLGISEQIVDLWPHFVDLTVESGDLTKLLTNIKETGLTSINTSSLLEDAAGNTVNPAVGDLLIRVENLSGGGTLDFAYGLSYFVE